LGLRMQAQQLTLRWSSWSSDQRVVKVFAVQLFGIDEPTVGIDTDPGRHIDAVFIQELCHLDHIALIEETANTTYIKDGRVFDHTELFLHPELYQLNMIKYKDS
ncbi:MAG: hypothetical protein ACLVJX_08815, partial [Merdibacter sp.]